jgi:putative ABC transport system permease protein
VVLQFSLAIFLLVATIVYYKQMDFIRTKDLGYEPSYVIRTSIKAIGKPLTVVAELKNGLAAEPSILSVSFGDDGQSAEIETDQHKLRVTYKNIDEDFLSTLNVSLLTGRNLSTKFPTDAKESILVNEAFVKAAGLTEPVGASVKIIQKYGTVNNQFQTSETTRIIRGVVKDFHFGSLRQAIEPLVLYTSVYPQFDIWIKINRAEQQQAMAAVERIYKKVLPGALYQYDFLDELNAREFQKEKRWQKLITVGSALALIICCLGLFGLAHLSTARRVKEIGIRKVLGATVTQISVLLSVNFLKLVVIAFVFAAPIAWWVMHAWLQEFAYRIEVGPGIFIGAAVFALVIAAATVSLHAIRSAWANPVKALRTE